MPSAKFHEEGRFSSVHEIQRHIQKTVASMSYAQRIVSMYVLRNMKTFFFLSTVELSDKVGVSQATVVRFCQAIGYQGYADFAGTVQACVQKEMSQWSEGNTQLPSFVHEDTHKGILDAVLGTQFSDMVAFAENFDEASLQQCVDMMMAAKGIYVLARMSTRPLGLQLVTMLAKVCPICHLMPDEDMESTVMLQRMERGDMLLAFSYPRYAKSTVDMVRIAKKANCSIAAITDSAASPLVPLADVSLFAPASLVSYIDLFAAPTALAAALALEYCNRSPKETAARLARFDDVSRKAHMFIS